MKRWFILFFVFIILIACNTACRNNDKQILYVLSRNFDYELLSVKRTDGDLPIYIQIDNENVHVFDVVWNNNGCVLNYRSDGKDERIIFYAGQQKEIEIYEEPILFRYDIYLSDKEEKFPRSWNVYFEIMQQKAQYETFEKFSESRHQLDELNVIQTSFCEANLDQNAEAWYKVFLESVWNHNDFSIYIVKANAEHKSDDIFVTLHLFDDKGNEMIIYGFTDDSIDYIKYNGKSYAGPFA